MGNRQWAKGKEYLGTIFFTEKTLICFPEK
jgi:hypothetical protein